MRQDGEKVAFHQQEARRNQNEYYHHRLGLGKKCLSRYLL